MTPEAKKLLAQILYDLEEEITTLSGRMDSEAGIDCGQSHYIRQKIEELGKIFDGETKETKNDQPDS